MNYEIQKGAKLNFRPMRKIPKGLSEFLVETFGNTTTVTAFCIVNRTKFWGLIKLPTIIVFYKNSKGFEEDNVSITRRFTEYFENADYFIDLITLDLSDKTSLEIAAGIDKMGVEIIDVKKT